MMENLKGTSNDVNYDQFYSQVKSLFFVVTLRQTEQSQVSKDFSKVPLRVSGV